MEILKQGREHGKFLCLHQMEHNLCQWSRGRSWFTVQSIHAKASSLNEELGQSIVNIEHDVVEQSEQSKITKKMPMK
jgi:hypothetical protein